MMSYTVLIVEDELFQRTALKRLLELQGHLNIREAESGEDALAFLSKQKNINAVGAVVMDIYMPGMGGVEALKRIVAQYPALPVIMLSASDRMEDAVACTKAGAMDFLSKPAQPERLQVVLHNALRLRQLSSEVDRLTRQEKTETRFVDLIGHERGLEGAVLLARKAAASEIPVLITGETGTGKEVLARAIHGESGRRGKPFVAVNCGSIPENLIESHLFGHVKGAFTGAINNAPGKFREAEGGTLFLDEIGELPLEAQVRLLRVLQEKEVEPVGSHKRLPTDVRIISATHRDVSEGMELGAFREDLFYRLNGLPIHIPALRDRPQDIIPLAEHFINIYALRENVEVEPLDEETHQMLIAHRWPGNVREMENTLHRTIVIGGGVTAPLLQQCMGKRAERLVTEQAVNRLSLPSNHAAITLFDEHGVFKSMDRIEQEAMAQALEFCKGNVTRAAALLDMAKSTFYRKQAASDSGDQ